MTRKIFDVLKDEEQLYLDAIDCFCKSIPSSASREQLRND